MSDSFDTTVYTLSKVSKLFKSDPLKKQAKRFYFHGNVIDIKLIIAAAMKIADGELILHIDDLHKKFISDTDAMEVFNHTVDHNEVKSKEQLVYALILACSDPNPNSLSGSSIVDPVRKLYFGRRGRDVYDLFGNTVLENIRTQCPTLKKYFEDLPRTS